MYIRGKPWIVTVDDNFLFLDKEDNLRYAKADTKFNTLWVQILEKAMAKVKGNYYFLIAGDNNSVLNMLTGAPVFSYSLHNIT